MSTREWRVTKCKSGFEEFIISADFLTKFILNGGPWIFSTQYSMSKAKNKLLVGSSISDKSLKLGFIGGANFTNEGETILICSTMPRTIQSSHCSSE